jgi:tetratricopeptide (TPR) repeat protein
MFKAGDVAGGLQEFRVFVDANPNNQAARQRIGSTVYDRGRELEAKGLRAPALGMYEQAVALRGGKPLPEWTARIAATRKALADDYYDKGMQAYRTDVGAAIKLWETSLRYDPQHPRATAKLAEAKKMQEKLGRIPQDTKPR